MKKSAANLTRSQVVSDIVGTGEQPLSGTAAEVCQLLSDKTDA